MQNLRNEGLWFVFNLNRQVCEALGVEEDDSDVNAIKSENKEIRH